MNRGLCLIPSSKPKSDNFTCSVSTGSFLCESASERAQNFMRASLSGVLESASHQPRQYALGVLSMHPMNAFLNLGSFTWLWKDFKNSSGSDSEAMYFKSYNVFNALDSSSLYLPPKVFSTFPRIHGPRVPSTVGCWLQRRKRLLIGEASTSQLQSCLL